MRDPRSASKPDPAESDVAVLDRLRNGDRAALAELMDTFWGPLNGYALRMLGCADASQDVVQDTFVRLWAMRERITCDGSAGALLHQITRNLCLKRVRHWDVRTRKENEVRQAFLKRPVDPLRATMVNEARDVLHEAIDALPPRRREAFVLLRYQGLSLDEAAKVMNLSKQTVANHAVMALQQLRAQLLSYKRQ